MNKRQIVNLARIVNIGLIATTIIVFVLWKAAELTKSMTLINMALTSATVYKVVAVIFLVVSAFLLIKGYGLKNKGESKIGGLELLVAGAAIMFGLAMMEYVLGIAIWVLAALSLKQLSDTTFETGVTENVTESVTGKVENENEDQI